MCRRRCCGPTGWWPARRPPGPRVWPVTSAGVTPRRAARRWWCSITTRRVRPGRSSRWSRPSRRSLPASRSPTPGPAPSRPGDRRATTAATRRWRCWQGGLGGAGVGGRGPGGLGGAAARAAWSTSGPAGPVVVPPGGGAAYLAPLPIEVLDDPGAAGGGVGGGAVPVHDMVGVFVRLGLRTLGDLAALPVAEIVGRFGAAGWTAHRLASGLDRRPPVPQPPPPDLTVAAELDPPVERVEAAAFVARGLADDLHRRLTARGSACTRLIVGVETEHGERHERGWRTEGTFSALAIADRVRWQLDGWLAAGAHRPSGPLIRLWLAPEEVVPAAGRQLAFNSGGPGVVPASGLGPLIHPSAGKRNSRQARFRIGRCQVRGWRPQAGR